MSNLSELCQHRWESILVTLGVPEKLLSKKHQPCPLCDGGTDRFRWTDHLGSGAYICNQCGTGDGIKFLMEFTGKEFKDVATDIEAIIGTATTSAPVNADVEKTRAKLIKAWRQAKPLSKGCPTHRYLINRGLAGTDFGSLAGLRCHPGLTYWHVEGGEVMNLGKHPAMIGAVTTPAGEPATLHCTYLTADGKKAALDPVRKLMTPSREWKGGAIRLQSLQAGQTLCVAEGIESALSLKLLHPDVCPWACISAGNMESFVPPNHDSDTIYIGGDNDEGFAGQAAAFALARKLSVKKFKASVLMPEKIGTDFNDELNSTRRLAS